METASKIKISMGEIARMLGWNYEATKQINKRKSPPHKYQMIKECERKLIQAKTSIQNQFQNH